jgi:hypothetical protein
MSTELRTTQERTSANKQIVRRLYEFIRHQHFAWVPDLSLSRR